MFELILYICTVGGPVPCPRIPAPVPAYVSKQDCLEGRQALLEGKGGGVALSNRPDIITACEPIEV